MDTVGSDRAEESGALKWPRAEDDFSPLRVRLSPSVLIRAQRGRLVATHTTIRTERVLEPAEFSLVQRALEWTAITDLVGPEAHASERSSLLEGLVEDGLFEVEDKEATQKGDELRSWGPWHPTVSDYHFATRDVQYVHQTDPKALTFITQPFPSATKDYSSHHERIELPDFRRNDPVLSTIQARRSWRRFASSSLELDDLVVLLGNTWAVQHWLDVQGKWPHAYKTSPSGGARHSLEAYVAVANVRGLTPGLYHYGPDDHVITPVWSGAPPFNQFFQGQPWFHKVPAAVFMTSVFERIWWRYPRPRSYRSVMLEAGHFAQTFCLVATHLELAPFVTAALQHTLIEEYLGIEALRESVLYAVGVGNRPENVDWAPYPPQFDFPVKRLPAYISRLGEAADG